MKKICSLLVLIILSLNIHAQMLDCEEVTPPQTLADLTGGTKTFIREMTLMEAKKMNIIYSTGERSKQSKVIVHDFLQYKNTRCAKGGRRVRNLVYGVGVRLTVTVISAKKQARLTNLASISAAVEYDLAEVIYELHAIGITGDKVRLSMAESGKFGVNDYANWITLKGEIIKLIGDDGISVKPQLIIDEYARK